MDFQELYKLFIECCVRGCFIPIIRWLVKIAIAMRNWFIKKPTEHKTKRVITRLRYIRIRKEDEPCTNCRESVLRPSRIITFRRIRRGQQRLVRWRQPSRIIVIRRIRFNKRPK